MAFDWVQITRDFQQKYEHSFIRVKIKDDFEVFWVYKIQAGNPPYLLLRNAKHGEIQLNYDTDFEISFDYPKIGIFDWQDKIALMFVRQYQRQWKRGISNASVLVKCPYADFFSIDTELCEVILEDAFKPRAVKSIGEVRSKLGPRLSLCLNNHFSLGLDVRQTNDTYLLWYMDSLVGELKQNVMYIKEPQFQQEFNDYLRGTGEMIHVIV